MGFPVSAAIVGALILVGGASGALLLNDSETPPGAESFAFAVGRIGDALTYETFVSGGDWTVARLFSVTEFEVGAPLAVLDHAMVPRDVVPTQVTSTLVNADGTPRSNAITVENLMWLDLTDRTDIRQAWEFAFSLGYTLSTATFGTSPSRIPGLAFQGETMAVGDQFQVADRMFMPASGAFAGAGHGSLVVTRISALGPAEARHDPSAIETERIHTWTLDRIEANAHGRTAVLVQDEPVTVVGAGTDGPRTVLIRTEMSFDEGVPYPVRVESYPLDGSTDPNARTIESLSDYAPGQDPVPWDADGGSAAPLVSAGEHGAGLPVDGEGSTLYYPFAEAYEDVTSSLLLAEFTLWRQQVGAHALASAIALPGAHGAEDREALMWYFEFASASGSFIVLAERIEGLPVAYVEEIGEHDGVRLDEVQYTPTRMTLADAERAYRALHPDAGERITYVQWGAPTYWRSSGSCVIGASTESSQETTPDVGLRTLWVGETNVGACMADETSRLRAVAFDQALPRLLGMAQSTYTSA